MRVKANKLPVSHDNYRCRELSLAEVRSAAPIPSGFSSETAYRLNRCQDANGVQWTLETIALPHPLDKVYDTGDTREWLRSYPDAGRPEDFRFTGCLTEGRLVGLLTWRLVQWNEVLWLVDLRVYESSRRLGVGTRLVASIQAECRRRLLRGITVETQTSNYPAVNFYLKAGFEIVGFHERLYGNDDMQRDDVALFLFWQD